MFKIGKSVNVNNLIEAYYNDVYKYAFYLSKSKDIAEDITQSTFEIAIKKANTIKDKNKAKSWLITTLRREFFAYQKSDKKYVFYEDNEIEDMLGGSYNYNEELIDVQKEIYKLDEKYKEPLLLNTVLGFSTQEISKILSMDKNTVLTRVYRAKNKIKEKLETKDSFIKNEQTQ